jgi:phage baseplate assembly protein W
MMADEGRIFGRGVAFPPRVGPDGRIAFSVGAENVRQSIRVILLTEPGERIMHPAFGGGLQRFLFQPNTAATHRLIEETIQVALGRSEPRLRLDAVDVGPDPAEDRAAIAMIRYTLVATGVADSVGLRVPLGGSGGPA